MPDSSRDDVHHDALASKTDASAIVLDSNAELRAPLTLLLCLVPVGLLGELYRYVGRPIGEPKQQLLIDPLVASAGSALHVMPPLVSVLVLVVGCLFAQIVSRRPWHWPTPRTVLLIVAWTSVWACARLAIGWAFQSSHLDHLVAETGTALSGALQEELVFRCMLLGGLLWISRYLGLPSSLALPIALVISAVTFSLAHTQIINHFSGAEMFAWRPFLERAVAGLLYGFIFIRQGLAVSTLSHAMANVGRLAM